MNNEFKINVSFNEQGEEIESIISYYLMSVLETKKI